MEIDLNVFSIKCSRSH